MKKKKLDSELRLILRNQIRKKLSDFKPTGKFGLEPKGERYLYIRDCFPTLSSKLVIEELREVTKNE